MTTNAIEIELEPRELMGKKVRRLRRAGIVPVHLYGPGMEPRALQCGTSRLIRVLAAAGGATPIHITIQGESGTHLAFAREIQWHPKRDDLLHVDLLAADISRPVTAQVPIVLVGESAGARSANGTGKHQLRTLSSHPRGNEPGRVHAGGGRQDRQAYAIFPPHTQVFLDTTGVGRQVCLVTKLGRVHIDAGHYGLAFLTGLSD